MPTIHVYMHEGRSQEQKKGLVVDITAAVEKNTGAPPQATQVILHDTKTSDWATGGKFHSES